ncbi:lipocalin-like domain-containing protein [Pseudomonas eucalypticola]|uniref:Iron ABC transporter permease n=1 Tax=Pseudomonas eucalypticola TaxID=2599595 RepID=A0A7D5D9H8_9PSED|nr:lipocalin-like domain-containing protein [Pseudomonas eucalypticola]QKZ06218.1 iron ABC transporter permease [Pseudomonas eucalypticola]
MNVSKKAVGIGLLGLLLSACDAPPPPTGFAGLGGQAAGFAQVTPGAPLVFPRDHGAHPDYRIEWWYVTANLSAADGSVFGAQWTLFRSAQAPGAEAPGWSHRTVWLGHAALTGANWQHSAQALARGGIGQAGVETQPFAAWIDDWRLDNPAPSTAHLGNLRVQARAADFSYELNLRTDRPLVLQGVQGYSQKSQQGQASWYYSQPFYQVSGQVQTPDGQWHVTGQAWLDHEWSSQPLAANQQGWDWFSLHLDDGAQVMLFRLRQQGGPDFVSGSWTDADGHSEALDSGQVQLRPMGANATLDQHRAPTQWQVRIPTHGLDIRVEAFNPDAWMKVTPPYWEGPVRITGSHAGQGYLEMTGY